MHAIFVFRIKILKSVRVCEKKGEGKIFMFLKGGSWIKLHFSREGVKLEKGVLDNFSFFSEVDLKKREIQMFPSLNPPPQ